MVQYSVQDICVLAACNMEIILWGAGATSAKHFNL